ncbi:hypothetical protein D3C81_911040 [compost metagenome]
MAGLQQRQTLHRVIGHVPGGGRIVMADQLPALVARAAGGAAVEKTFDDPRRFTLQLLDNGHGAQLSVVMVLRSAATVPALQHLIGRTGQRQRPAGIDTEIEQDIAGQGRHRGAIWPKPFAKEPRILTFDFTALWVEPLARDMRLCRLLRIAAGIGDAAHDQASGIDDREGWRVGVQVGAVHVPAQVWVRMWRLKLLD